VSLIWGVIHFFCAVFAAVGVAFFVAGVRDALRAARTRRWPTVPGTVVSAEELQHVRPPLEGQDGRSTGAPRLHFEARVHYEYTVGQVHIGSTVLRLGATETSNEQQVQATLSRYLPGQAVPISYNPQDPTESVLEPGAHPVDFARLVVGVILVVLAFGIEVGARWFASLG
jgi:hypothetical protein